MAAAVALPRMMVIPASAAILLQGARIHNSTERERESLRLVPGGAPCHYVLGSRCVPLTSPSAGMDVEALHVCTEPGQKMWYW